MQGSILARLERFRSGNGNKSNAGSRKLVRWALVALVVAALAVWLFRERWQQAQFEWATFTSSFLSVRWHWILASWLGMLLTYWVRAVRWAVMLRPLRPEANRWGLFKATAIGFTAVVLLGRPAEFIRPYLISSRERVSFSSQLAAWFLERICDLLAVLLIFGFTLTQLDPRRTHVGPKLQIVLETGGWALGVVGLACLGILLMLGRFSEVTRKRLTSAFSVLPQRYHQRLDGVVSAFLDGTACTKHHASALGLVLYTLLEWFIILVGFYCLFQAYPGLAGRFTLRDVLVFMGFVAFGSVVQIPGVGGGVQIVSILVLTEVYGVGLELATSMAVMIWIITFVGIVPIGLSLAFHEGLNWKRLRQLEREAAAEAVVEGEAKGVESA